MIVDVLFFVLALVLLTIKTLLSAIALAIPDTWETAIHTLISYVGYLDGWVPLYANPIATGLWQDVGIFNILAWEITIAVMFYLVKLVLILLHLIPIFGKKLEMPHERRKE